MAVRKKYTLALYRFVGAVKLPVDKIITIHGDSQIIVMPEDALRVG